MSCPSSKCLCERLIISSGVTFAGNTLTINLPAGNYGNKCKYCIIIAQPIPTTTTIAANVVITIGTNTITYPLLNCDCTNVKACQIKTRYRYSTIVHTDMQSGVFKLTGKIGCKSCCQNIDSLPIPTTTTPAQEGENNA